jgi:hypothetical protein
MRDRLPPEPANAANEGVFLAVGDRLIAEKAGRREHPALHSDESSGEKAKAAKQRGASGGPH